jgi:hypothetical protein
MDTTSKAAPKTRHKHPPTRAERGLVLFRERGSEITEVSPGTYRVPGSDGATYTVSLDAGYCSCPDRVSPCKHLYCAEVYAAKKRCRRAARPADRSSRRHGERREDIREQQDERRRGTAPAPERGIDPARIRANVERMSS